MVNFFGSQVAYLCSLVLRRYLSLSFFFLFLHCGYVHVARTWIEEIGLCRDQNVDKYIINVSAMEGKFYRHKGPQHPHTNMAKVNEDGVVCMF